MSGSRISIFMCLNTKGEWVFQGNGPSEQQLLGDPSSYITFMFTEAKVVSKCSYLLFDLLI